MLGKGEGYINIQCPDDQAPETWPVETHLFLLFPKDLLDADAAGLAVSSGLDSQDFLWKMHQKNKNNQSLTFLEKSTTLSIVVKENLARKTSNQPSGDQKVSKKRKKREISENQSKSQRQSYHASVKIDAHPSPHSKGSRRVKDAFSGGNKVFLICKKISLKYTFNVHHIHQNIVWNFQWKLSPSSRLCLCNNRFWCPSSSLSSQVYIWAKTDGLEFCPHFTGWLLPAKSPWITFQDFVSSVFFCMFRQFATQFSNASFSLSNQMVKV